MNLMEQIEMMYELEQETRSINFMRESNAIEGIRRNPSKEEIKEFKRFMKLKNITIWQLEKFVAIYEPGAKLRTKEGDNVVLVDNGTVVKRPPLGGWHIKEELRELLRQVKRGSITSYEAHQQYEKLHPFSDCNGRSGRMLWCWMEGGATGRGFLHTWYYQSLK